VDWIKRAEHTTLFDFVTKGILQVGSLSKPVQQPGRVEHSTTHAPMLLTQGML